MKEKSLHGLARLAIGFLVLVQLAACSTTTDFKVTLLPDASSPYEGYFKKEVKQSARALVMVGAFGTEKLSRIKSEGYEKNSTVWLVVGGVKINDVYLVPVEVGNEFSIDKVEVDGEMFANIRSPLRMKIDRPGIYYYGKMVFNKRRVHMDYTKDKAVIDLARKKYLDVFGDDLPTVNF